MMNSYYHYHTMTPSHGIDPFGFSCLCIISKESYGVHFFMNPAFGELSDPIVTFCDLTFSIGHPFLGDYVRLRQNPQWKKICTETNDQYVVFADIINKITRSGGKVKNLRTSFTFYPEFSYIKSIILSNVNFEPFNLFFLSVCANIICDIY